MEEIPQTQNTQPPDASVVPQHPVINGKPGKPKTLIAAIIAVALGTLIVLAYQPIKGIQTVVAPTPTPISQATPTPIRAVSAIATQSAFLSLESSIASLSSSIQAFTVLDPSLTPPILDLTLKFNRK